MKRILCVLSVIIPALGMSACNERPFGQEPLRGRLSEAELAARLPADLGPGHVDVSVYPKEIQDSYHVFLAVCSACHTPARPLFSDIVSREDWQRYTHRMHVKANNRGFDMSLENEKQIVEFLAYDSKVRKLSQKEKFQAQREALKTVYAQMVRERERLIEQETRDLPKKETPYVGVK